jgi:hypothetical protein
VVHRSYKIFPGTYVTVGLWRKNANGMRMPTLKYYLNYNFLPMNRIFCLFLFFFNCFTIIDLILLNMLMQAFFKSVSVCFI